jgi:hypothetical protein
MDDIPKDWGGLGGFARNPIENQELLNLRF